MSHKNNIFHGIGEDMSQNKEDKNSNALKQIPLLDEISQLNPQVCNNFSHFVFLFKKLMTNKIENIENGKNRSKVAKRVITVIFMKSRKIFDRPLYYVFWFFPKFQKYEIFSMLIFIHSSSKFSSWLNKVNTSKNEIKINDGEDIVVLKNLRLVLEHNFQWS